MNALAWVGMAGVLATDAPVLPSMASMQLWLHGGWMLITVWLASAILTVASACCGTLQRRRRWSPK